MPTIEDAVDPKLDTEPARINSINFYNNHKVSTKTLLASVGVKPGEVMAKEKMGLAMDSIVAQYKAIGAEVAVRPRVSHPKRNFVDLNFLIDENGKGGHD